MHIATKKLSILSNKNKLFSYKNLTCHAIHYAEQHPELMGEIYKARKLSYDNHGFNGDAMTCYNKGAPYSYQVILWDNRENKVIAGYVFNLADEIANNLGMDHLWLSRTFADIDQVVYRDAKTVMLEHSFVDPSYQKNSLALVLIWRGVTSLAKRLFSKCYFIGVTGMPFKKYPKEVYSLYISCLRNSSFFVGKKFAVKSLFPFDETKHLSPEQIRNSSKSMEFHEMEQHILSSTGFRFKIPVLLRNYTKYFDAKIINFGLSEKSGSLMALQLVKYCSDQRCKLFNKAYS